MCQISKKSLGSGDTLAATFGRSGSPVETKQKQRRQWCRPVAAPSFFLPRQVLWAGLLLLGLWFPATSRLFVFPWSRTCASRSGSRCLWVQLGLCPSKRGVSSLCGFRFSCLLSGVLVKHVLCSPLFPVDLISSPTWLGQDWWVTWEMQARWEGDIDLGRTRYFSICILPRLYL